MPSLRAIIYLRSLDYYDRAVAHCQQRGLRVIGVVHDPDGDRWLDVVEACLSGQCEVIVLPRLDDLPSDRLPRTEIVEMADVPAETADEVRPLFRRPRPRY